MDQRRGRRALVGLAALTALTAGCTPSSAVPTDAKVAALLKDAHAARTVPDELCSLATADLNCHASLEGAPLPPAQAPTVACTGTFDAPEGRADGTLARVQGVDGRGTEYDSSLLAITTHEGARFVDPFYWAASGISTGSTTDESNRVELAC